MKWVILGIVCSAGVCHDGRPYDDVFVTLTQCRAAAAYYAAHPDWSRRRWQRYDRCEQIKG